MSNRNSFTAASRCAMLSSPDRKKYPTANRAASVDDRIRLMWSTSFSFRLSMMSCVGVGNQSEGLPAVPPMNRLKIVRAKFSLRFLQRS